MMKSSARACRQASRSSHRLLLVAAAVLTVCGQLAAQLITGTISGRVIDPSDQVVVGASVTLISERTGESRTTQTNETGAFVFPALPPGVYTIKVEYAGFQAFQQTGTVLSATERLSVGDIKLSLGTLGESVTVTAEGMQVQTASTERGALLDANQMNMILVRGRDPISLLRVLPGVQHRADIEALGPGYGTSLPNIQGIRAQWNSVAVDGLVGNDLGDAPVFSSSVNMDAISEVKVLLNNYPAEYGRNAGAVINIVTKSGTRDFRGTAYWYKRHEQFNANNFFNNLNNVPKPRYRYTTLGATLGGPVYLPNRFNRDRDKLFFFYSFEGWLVQDPGSIQRVTMPSALERGGDFSQSLDLNDRMIVINDPLTARPFPGNVVPRNRLNANGQAILNIFPLPNFLDRRISGGAYNYVFEESRERPKRQHLFKVDYRPTSKDSISVRGSTWFGDNRGYAVPAGTSAWGLARLHYKYTDDGIVLSHTRMINPTTVNEFFAGARHGTENGPPVSSADLARMVRTTHGITLRQLYPENNPLNVIPLASFGGLTGAASISFDGRFPLRGADTVFNFSDNLTVIRGSHTMKFGVFVERVRNYEGERGAFAGNFSFGRDVNNPFDSNHPYANALLGNFLSYTESSTRPGTQGRAFSLEWFAQDSWKVTRKLTLDYGMRFTWYTQWKQIDGRAAAFALERYDLAKAPRLYWPGFDAAGRRSAVNPITGAVFPAVMIGAFVPGSGDPVNGMVVATDKTYPEGFKEQQPVQFGPRFGFAYDPTGHGKTAFRGGFGILYNTRPSGNRLWDLPTNPPVQYNPMIFYGNLDTFLTTPGVLFPSNVVGFDRRSITPAAYNLFLGIQKDIGFNTVADVSYVGTLGRHLMQTRNLNTVPYGARFLRENADPTGPTRPLPDNFFRPYPGHGAITYNENAGTSNYNSLQVAVNRRYVRGLQFGLAYTWSKAMSYTDTDGGLVAMYRPIRVWNYGKASFDQTHNFIFNYIWDVPKASRLWNNLISRLVLDNWQVAGITSLVSGQPSGVGFTTTDGADITGGGDGVRIVVTGKAQLPHGQRKFHRWFVPEVFRRPAIGDFGNAPKDVFRLPGFNNWDISLFKNFPVKSEARHFQLRWEMYNTFNHTQFAGVDATARFDPAGAQVNPRFAQVTSARSPRVMQASLRFTF